MFKLNRRGKTTSFLAALLILFVMGCLSPLQAQYTGPWWWQLYDKPTSASWTFTLLSDIVGIASSTGQVLKRTGPSGIEWGEAGSGTSTGSYDIDFHVQNLQASGTINASGSANIVGDVNASGSSNVVGTSSAKVFVEDGVPIDQVYVAIASVGAVPSTYVSVQFGSGLNVNNTTNTLLEDNAFGTVESDILGDWDSSTGSFTAPVTGYYAVNFSIAFDATDQDGHRQGYLLTTGTVYGANAAYFIEDGDTGDIFRGPSGTTLYMTAGSEISFWAYQDSGSTLSAQCAISIKRIPEPYIDTPHLATSTWVDSYLGADWSLPDSAYTVFTAASETSDVLIEWDGATFTANVSGFYLFTVQASFDTTDVDGDRLIATFKNGTDIKKYGQRNADPINNTVLSHVCQLNLNAGDQISFKLYQNSGSSIGVVTGNTSIQIRRIPDPYADLGRSYVRADAGTTGTFPTGEVYCIATFPIVITDSNGEYDAAGTFTSKRKGRFEVRVQLIVGTAQQVARVALYLNGTLLENRSQTIFNSAYSLFNCTFVVDLNVGDTVAIYLASSATGYNVYNQEGLGSSTLVIEQIY